MGAWTQDARAIFAELEALGLLTHRHTSGGRVPTESGYRYYADELLHRLDPQPAEFPVAFQNLTDYIKQHSTPPLATPPG